jgi:tol-pal system protein YbgF
LLLLAILPGCAGNDLIVQRQSSMEGRLEQIMQAQNSAKSGIAAVSAQMQELKEQSARQAASEKELLVRYEELQAKMNIISNRLALVESVAKQSSTIELVNQGSIPEGREESVQAAYMKAFGLFSANSYSAAAEAFNSFVSDYPESEYAANARYWLGECYFSLGRYKEAIESFTRVLEMNPLPKRAADAMLRIGTAWYRLDNPSKGSATLKLLIEKYPGSEAAGLAGKHLENK